MSSTVSVKYIQGILDTAVQCNLNAEEIITASRLAPELFKNIDSRISHEKFCTLWQEIAHRSSEPYIGLRMAKFVKPVTFNVLGYAVSNSMNLEEAMQRFVRYSRLMHTESVYSYEVQGNIAQFSMTTPYAIIPLPQSYSEWIVANIVLWIRKITGIDIVPLRLRFQHSAPEDLSAYHHLFHQAPLEFEQPDNGATFDAELLKQPVLGADLELCKMLDDYAKRLLVSLSVSNNLVDRVRQRVVKKLQSGNLKIELIAKEMGFASRTLQQKLREAGTSYRDLLDEVRQELSMYCLREKQISISEISFLLGLSEISAFDRAFKRWAGMSPSEFRAIYYGNSRKMVNSSR